MADHDDEYTRLGEAEAREALARAEYAASRRPAALYPLPPLPFALPGLEDFMLPPDIVEDLALNGLTYLDTKRELATRTPLHRLKGRMGTITVTTEGARALLATLGRKAA